MSAYEAVRIRLDPTPRQTRLLESHAGGARFAYNLMLAHVQRQISLGEKPDWTLYAMRRWWNEWKDEIAPWWRENSKEAYHVPQSTQLRPHATETPPHPTVVKPPR